MKNFPNKKAQNDIFVAVILTESTSSLLKLDVPHIANSHPENSQIRIITADDYKTLIEQKNDTNSYTEIYAEDENTNDSTSNVIVSSDIGLFSTSNCSSNSEMYDISEQSTRNASSSTKKLFQPIKIIAHPLVSAKSKAHANKLDVQYNDLYVKLLESDSYSSSDFICRICHGGESIGDLLTPCRCRGTVALIHLKCLERWLKESNHTSCELCQHRYRVIREPKYSIPWSIVLFLRHPGHHLRDLLCDLMFFAVYTPSAVGSTYMMLLICEALVKNKIVTNGSISSHIIAFSAVLGMAAIDFTYSSWLVLALQKHIDAWKEWYNSNSKLTIVLSNNKMKPRKKHA